MKSIGVNQICKNCRVSFLAAAKEVKRGNGKFCSLSCAATYTNITCREIRTVNCKFCRTPFETSRTNTLWCSMKCKNVWNGRKRKGPTALLKELPCEICGWNESTRDQHHLIAIAEGGSNDISNKISVCPNHHRMIHKGQISLDDLKEIVNKRTISSST